jgi:4-alpha-glucanotransferase
MKKVYFLFCIHNHQPVGNLDHLFRDAFTKAYIPLLDHLERHPLIRVCLHYSGTLLEWITAHAPEILGRLRLLIERNQVELLSGGFYEPIFMALRDPDITGQITMMNTFLERYLGCKPRGIWLAERVWDPVLPRLIADAGLSYTLLDSTHLLHAGVPAEQIHGYYMTERNGSPLAIFPINRQLRYSIPFKPPGETIASLRYMAGAERPIAVTYGDDGEKFGLWPGTAKSVYEDGWLEQFFTALEENSEMIQMTTFSEYLDAAPATGSIYLPSLSYDELMEWALPADAVVRFEDMLHTLEDSRMKEQYRSFIHGGCWSNFLVKYPEANHMHKKMLRVSKRLESLQPAASADTQAHLAGAQVELYQAQCNCAYWHGIFGGVYLNYLRHAVYEHLINAENLLDRVAPHGPGCEAFDFRCDGTRMLRCDSPGLSALFAPDEGGALVELDVKPRSFNITNTLSRRMESYHRFLKRENINGAKALSAQSMATGLIPAETIAALQSKIAYDWYRRYSFMDHFLGSTTTLESFSQSQYPELGDFVQAPYAVAQTDCDPAGKNACITLARDGFITHNATEYPIRITKRFTMDYCDMRLDVAYTLHNMSGQALELWFGTELNLTLLAGDDRLRYYRFAGFPDRELLMNTRAAFGNIEAFSMVDEWSGMEVRLGAQPATGVWVLPLETVARSENGCGCSYQHSTLLLHRKVRLEPQEHLTQSFQLFVALFKGKKKRFEKTSKIYYNQT